MNIRHLATTAVVAVGVLPLSTLGVQAQQTESRLFRVTQSGTSNRMSRCV